MSKKPEVLVPDPPSQIKDGHVAYLTILDGEGYRSVFELKKEAGRWVERRLVEKTLPREARSLVQSKTITAEMELLRGL